MWRPLWKGRLEISALLVTVTSSVESPRRGSCLMWIRTSSYARNRVAGVSPPVDDDWL